MKKTLLALAALALTSLAVQADTLGAVLHPR
jgi:hypothetical protein